MTFLRAFSCLFLLVCVQQAAAQTFTEPPPWQAAPRVAPTVPPAITRLWYAKHRQLLQRGRDGRYQIIFIGDSNTEGWEDRGRDTWDRLFAPFGALNLGINGDTTQNVLWRIAHGELDGLSPRLVILLIGAGDIILPRDHGLWTPQEIVRGIATVKDAIRLKVPQAHIIVLALFPAGKFPNQPVRHWQVGVDAVLSRTDLGPNAAFMDLGSHYLRPDGHEAAELYQPDGLHLSPAGYAREGALLEPRVRQLVQ